jgi:transcriptional regulator with XRE-family HTH domain
MLLSRTDIASRLRTERERVGLTLSAIAEKTHVSRATQLSYESGTTSPSAEYLCKIHELGLDHIYIVSGIRYNSESEFVISPERLWMAVENTIELAKQQEVLLYSKRELGETVLAIYKTLSNQLMRSTLEKGEEVGHVEK